MMTPNELLGKLPTPIKNPFESKHIYYVSMEAYYWSSSKKWGIEGMVKFRNDSTEGTQRFEANTMDELYLKIQEFINSMK